MPESKTASRHKQKTGSAPAASPAANKAERDITLADNLFAALAHPARRQILLSVHFRGECTAGEIANRFECSWPTTSRHLAMLVTSGLLTVNKQGRSRLYTANSKLIGEVLSKWSGFFQ